MDADLPQRPRLGRGVTLPFGSGTLPPREVGLDRARVAGWPGPLGRLRLKQWEHWLVVTPEVAVTFAAVDAAYTRLAWIQVIDRRDGTRIEHRREGPLVRARLCDALWDDRSYARSANLAVELHNHLDRGGHRAVCTAISPGLPAVGIDLWAESPIPATEPRVVVLPVGRNRAMYSHKVPLPVSGAVRVGEKRYAVDRATATAVLDVHKAHYPRDTWWNWATAVGFDDAGRRVGFNLTANVAEGDANENAAWIDGRHHDLGPGARFSLASDPWTALVGDGTGAGLDVTFTAAGERSENIDLGGFVRSRFRQRYGTFSGTLRLPDGTVPLRDWFGLMEDHHARW